MTQASPRPTVLIVEDDADLRVTLADVLADEGYTVATADDGVTALRQLGVVRPDVIVLDLLMPTMSGWEFRHRQRADPALADIPVIVFSALGDPRHTAGLDAVAVLRKPLDVATLLGALVPRAPTA